MAVTKQTYTLGAGFDRAAVATALRSALIDAGLMTEWFDSFNVSTNRAFRVMKIDHDSTKTFGAVFYYFVIENGGIAVAMATNGWKTEGVSPINVPTGTQYLDWHTLPVNTTIFSNNTCTDIFSWSTTSNLLLERYTSQSDSKQSWFVFRQPAGPTRSQPFTFLHKDTALHSWLDLNKGCISGFSRILLATSQRAGTVGFTIEENLRRCLSIGHTLRGNVNTSGNLAYHGLRLPIYFYSGLGSESNNTAANFPVNGSTLFTPSIPLPIGRNANNSLYMTDYVPICTNLPWSYYTPTRLADDLGVYMHYSANDIAYGTKFIVTSTTNEWETIGFANNSNVNDGASATFLVRTI